MYFFSDLESSIGPLRLTSDGKSLVSVHMMDPDDAASEPCNAIRDDDRLARARDQLTAYFARERTTFDLPIAPQGTPFQLRVWDALLTIPYGETISYKELARRAGSPAASRAVGAANGRNPLPIIVPCHRVIGADGSLTGYGGGIDRKRTLLALERGDLFT